MNKDFVNYKTALALKELGFDERCFGHYNPNGVFFWKILCSDEDNDHTLSVKDIMQHSAIGYTEAPFYFQAFNWFREKYGMHHGIGFNGSWYYDIDSMKNCDEGVYEVAHKWDIKTYEEAEQACLEKLIEIIKKNAHI